MAENNISTTDSIDLEEKATVMSKTTRFIIEIAGSAIFGALSIILSSFLTPILPRVPGWGIAFIDPVSIIWVICFLVFGYRAGILCCVIGTIGLLPFDPFSPIGPLMKFCATIPLVIIPILLLRLYKLNPDIKGSQKIKNPKNFVVTEAIGVLLRIVIMVGFNVLLFITLFANSLSYVSLEFIGLPGVSGWTAVIIGAVLINAETSLWDLLIPYLIVFGLKLDERFDFW